LSGRRFDKNKVKSKPVKLPLYWPATRYDHFNSFPDQLIGQLKQPWSIFGGPVLNDSVITLRVAKLTQTLAEYLMGPTGAG